MQQRDHVSLRGWVVRATDVALQPAAGVRARRRRARLHLRGPAARRPGRRQDLRRRRRLLGLL